jgi:hypothetical protein
MTFEKLSALFESECFNDGELHAVPIEAILDSILSAITF